MPKNNSKGKVYPCHVQIKLFGKDSKVFCPEGDCCELASPALRGKQSYFCDHVKSAFNMPCVSSTLDLPPLSEVFMSPQMKTQVSKFKGSGDEISSQLVVKWLYQTDCTHFSVFTGTVRHWCPLGRTIVTESEGELSCLCSGPRSNCLHKAAVCWHINKPFQVAEETVVETTTPSTDLSKNEHDWLTFLKDRKIDCLCSFHVLEVLQFS